MTQELEERLRQAERIPGFREFLAQQTYQQSDDADEDDRRVLRDLDLDMARGMVACLFSRSYWRYGAGSRYFVDIGAFRGGRGVVAGEIPVGDQLFYTRVRIVEIADGRVKIRTTGQERTGDFEFAV